MDNFQNQMHAGTHVGMYRRFRMGVFLTLAVLGFVGGFYLVQHIVEQLGGKIHGSDIDFVTNSVLDNPLALGVTMDAVFTGLAFVIWVVHEARTLSMRYPWLYVLLVFTTPLAFVFPFFLFMREWKLATLGWD